MKFLDVFERSASAQSAYYRLHKNTDIRFNPGICKVCGQHFDVLLHSHAELDGYKNAYEMIKDGVIVFDFEQYRRKR